MRDRAILLSIHPRHAESIFAGTKTAELRRVYPREIGARSLVLLYVSAPVRSLVGALEVDEVVHAPIDELWCRVEARAGVTYDEFYAYFAGASTGTAILFSRLWRLDEPIDLDEMRNELGLHPPQGYRYLAEEEFGSPQLSELRAITGRDQIDESKQGRLFE